MEKTSCERIIMNAVNAIESNTELFYQQKQNEGYQMLNTTLVMLMQAINAIKELQSDGDSSNIDELNYVLSFAVNALESKDTILLSDILYFDLKPLLEQNL